MPEEDITPGIHPEINALLTSLQQRRREAFQETVKPEKASVTPESLRDFETKIESKIRKLFFMSGDVPEGIDVAGERKYICHAVEFTDDPENPHTYAVEVGKEGSERGYFFLFPQEEETLFLSPYSEEVRLVVAGWERLNKEKQKEELEFVYFPENGALSFKRDGEEVDNPREAVQEFESFQKRLLEYEPSPVSLEEFSRRKKEEIGRMGADEWEKNLIRAIRRLSK